MTKSIMLVKIIIVVLISDASRELFLWLQFDRPTANALSIIVVGLSVYFLFSKGISVWKYTLTTGGVALWYWVVMKPIFNVLEVRIGLWAFLVCFAVMIAPAILLKIPKKKHLIKNNSPEN